MKITVIGTGYVGLVTGTCLSEIGHEVICLDINTQKIENLNRGILPIYEPGLEDIVKRNQKEKRLHFTTDSKWAVQASEIIFIAVGTPSGEDGSADMKYVLSAAATIAESMDHYKVVVNKSTVPVGTGVRVRETIQTILDRRGMKLEFDVVSNPEFLKEGAAVEDFMRPDRIVIGVESDRAQKLMERIYQPFVRNQHPVLFMDLHSSEMTKYAANAFLATKISFMNEISKICEKVGADVEKVRRGIGSDPRIGPHFIYAGLGYGGSCFPKDVRALLNMGCELDLPMHQLKATEIVNQEQRKFFIHRIESHYPSLKGKKVALWGLAFKPGTDDIREAPSLDIIEALLKQGALIQAYDPVATDHVKKHFEGRAGISFAEDQYSALDKADLLCLVTEWKPFREPDFEKMKAKMSAPVIFDGRNQYEPQLMKSMGFKYHCIGRCPETV